MKAKTKQPAKVENMSYETYAYIRQLLDSRSERLIDDFRRALNFIPNQTSAEIRRGEKSAAEKAYKIFSKEYAMIARMKEELHFAAANTYKDSPNAELRKFWGLS